MTKELVLTSIESIPTKELFIGDKLDKVITSIEKEVSSIHTDVSTEEGQANVRSIAYKVSKSISFLDKCRKEETKSLRNGVKVINDIGNGGIERLRTLQTSVRKELTEIEDKEKARKADHENNISAITETTKFVENDVVTSEVIRCAIDGVTSLYSSTDWEEFAKRADDAYTLVTAELKERLALTEKHEADKIRLEELEKAENDRLRVDREEKIASDAKKDEQMRIKRIADEEEKNKAKREADKEHKRAINNEALRAMVLAMSEKHSGNAEEAHMIAEGIIGAIVKNKIPHITINY